MLQEWLTAKAVVVTIGGLGGGLVRILTLRESARDAVITVIAGLFTAHSLSLPLAEYAAQYFSVELSPSLYLGMAYFTGLGGITISGFVLDFYRDPLSFLRRARHIWDEFRGRNDR